MQSWAACRAAAVALRAVPPRPRVGGARRAAPQGECCAREGGLARVGGAARVTDLAGADAGDVPFLVVPE